MDRFIRCNALRFDAKPVVDVAGHQEALPYFRALPDSIFKPSQIFFGLPLERDLDQDVHARRLVIHRCGYHRIAPDRSRSFEKSDAPVTGRRRKADLSCNVGVGASGVKTKESKYFAIVAIEHF